MKYLVRYSFEGNGQVEIEAESGAEAKELFFEGEFEDENILEESFYVDNVEETI